MRLKLAIILGCLLIPSCVCFAPCPMSPNGWSYLGCLPPGISVQGASQPQEESITPDEITPSSK